jgi:hypothetical protein
MKCYKVQRLSDSLFWDGNISYRSSSFSAKGKTWKQLSHVRSAITLHNENWKKGSLSGCEIVEYELVEVTRKKV